MILNEKTALPKWNKYVSLRATVNSYEGNTSVSNVGRINCDVKMI
jgi:hypothetical protein